MSDWCRFHGTFYSSHPNTGCYVVVVARSEADAVVAMNRQFGRKWAVLFPADRLSEIKGLRYIDTVYGDAVPDRVILNNSGNRDNVIARWNQGKGKW